VRPDSSAALRFTAAAALRRGLVALLLVCGVGLLVSTPSDEACAAQGAAARAEKLLSPYVARGLKASVLMVDAAGRALFSHDSREALVPASLAKIAVVAACLDHLPGDFELRTRLYAAGRVENGVLRGSLVVVGEGDVGIDHRMDAPEKVFARWAEAVVKAGIRRVEGDLLLDATRFSDRGTPPGYPPELKGLSYAAPVSALSVDGSTLKVSVSGTKPGRPAKVVVVPAGGARVRNKLVTTAVKKSHLVHIQTGDDGVLVRGRCWSKVRGRTFRAPAPRPARVFGLLLADALAKAGVTLDGDLREATDAPDLSEAVLLAEHRTPLTKALAVMMRESVNVYADTLLQVLALAKTGRGSFSVGLRLLRRTLARAGARDAELENGSGLSRKSLMSAADCVALLKFIARRRRPDSLLAAPGEGTLRRRFRRPPLKNALHAKTGHLRSVNAVAGTLRRRRGTVYFAIVFNNTGGFRSRGLHALQEKLLGLFLEDGGG